MDFNLRFAPHPSERELTANRQNAESSVASEYAQQLIEKLHFSYSDCLIDYQTDLVIRKSKEKEDISSRSQRGISLRAFTGKWWAYANTSDTNHSAIRKLPGKLRAKGTTATSVRLVKPEPITFDQRMPVKKDAQTVALEDKLQKLREVFELAKTMDPRVVDVQATYSDSLSDRAIVSSVGTVARQTIPRTRIGLTVIVKDEGAADYDYTQLGGTVGYEVVDDFSEQNVHDTVESAIELLKAASPPAGPQVVILDPGVVGTVCHESFGHGLEADQALRGRSYLKDLLGKKVASELVTMYEDSSLESAFGSYLFDDDGTPARKNTIVEDGVLVGFIHDMESAAAMGTNLTANSRTQGATRRRFIRMSNTYAKPGEQPVDDIIRDTRDGIFVTHWLSGMEDPLGGGMQVIAKKGYLIKNGIKTAPLKMITLTGRVLEVLGNVDAVSKDGFKVDSGNCGKGGEDFVPVGSGGTWWRTKAVIA